MLRNLLIFLLSIFRRVVLLYRQLRGNTEADEAAERIASGRSWDEFCDTLKAAGASLHFPGTPRDAFSQAEGYRYLSRLARAGLEAFIEHADSRAPVLHRVANETVKMGADNPDNCYLTACVDGRLRYRILGSRGTVHILSFATNSGHYGSSGGLTPTGHVDAKDLAIGANGRFELVLSSTPERGNWLPMALRTTSVIVRQTFMDRERERGAELTIEVLDSTCTPSPLTPQSVDKGLRDASTLVAGASLLFAKWARDFQAHSNMLPRFDPDRSRAAGGDPEIAYYHSHWAVGNDEALLIEATPPECEYWNFQLNNYWMESMDYRYFQIHINKHTCHYERDGSFRIIVSHVDPALPNWIHTTGHVSGTMCFRWMRARHTPQPRTKVLKMTELIALGKS